jgi:peptidoglycan/LPS O-acetylase OafA/YrhL
MPSRELKGEAVQKLRSVQALRAIAACAVVVLHAVPDARAPVGGAGYGAAGVDLFFVISGFIMANVSKGRTGSEFVRDRLWRIYRCGGSPSFRGCSWCRAVRRSSFQA